MSDFFLHCFDCCCCSSFWRVEALVCFLYYFNDWGSEHALSAYSGVSYMTDSSEISLNSLGGGGFQFWTFCSLLACISWSCARPFGYWRPLLFNRWCRNYHGIFQGVILNSGVVIAEGVVRWKKVNQHARSAITPRHQRLADMSVLNVKYYFDNMSSRKV